MPLSFVLLTVMYINGYKDYEDNEFDFAITLQNPHFPT